MSKLAFDPPVSASQRRLMEAAAHTEGGYGGVSQAVAKKFLSDDMSQEEWSGLIDGMEKFLQEEKKELEHAADSQTIDFGPKSGRNYDPQNGFLHVRCHISKACVNPYRGNEIPEWEALKLDPNQVYKLFRDPRELALGAPTFHNVPLMRGHPAGGVTSATEHLQKVGSIANPEFNDPYLDADVVVWDDGPIAGIETDTQRELSSSYGYTPVMEPGEHEGTKYDGRMTAIHANHVALVEAGRAGPDVIVGDAALKDHHAEGDYIMPVASRRSVKSVLALGAITGYIAPKLAADSKFDATGIKTVLAATTGKNWLQQKPRLAAAIQASMSKVKFATDASMEDIHKLLDSLDDEDVGGARDGDLEDDKKAADAEETEEERKERMERRADDRKAGRDCAVDEEDETEEEKEHRKEARDRRAKDRRMGADASEEEREKAEKEHKAEDRKAWDARMRARDAKSEPGMDKKAMDAAISKAVRDTEARVIARLNSIAEAKSDVLPYVGDFSGAADSAEEIYRFALDQAGVEHAAIKEVAALRAMVKMLPKPGDQTGPSGGGFAADRAPGYGSGSGGNDDWLKTFGVGA